MKSTIIKFGIYITIIILIHYFTALSAGSYFDPFYLRFTTGKHHSIILGTSRAAQGLLPEELNKNLGDEYSPLFNFAFTGLNSPFGKVYSNAILQKLDTTKTSKKNVFIISVDPWSISIKNNPTDNPEKYRENGLFLDIMKTIGKKGKPNYEYLIKGYSESWGKILYRPITNKKIMTLHNDGWLEVNVPMDETAVKNRITAKVKSYNKISEIYHFSPNRFLALKKLVLQLKKHGIVVLVRMPARNEIKIIENKFFADFDNKICALSSESDVRYWSFMNQLEEHTFTDGTHLFKDSGRKISKQIATMIKTDTPSTCN